MLQSKIAVRHVTFAQTSRVPGIRSICKQVRYATKSGTATGNDNVTNMAVSKRTALLFGLLVASLPLVVPDAAHALSIKERTEAIKAKRAALKPDVTAPSTATSSSEGSAPAPNKKKAAAAPKEANVSRAQDLVAKRDARKKALKAKMEGIKGGEAPEF